MKYALRCHGFVEQFGYDVWEILENGVSDGTLYPKKESAQKEVDFYNTNNITRQEYKNLLKSDPKKAMDMWIPGMYEKVFKNGKDLV